MNAADLVRRQRAKNLQRRGAEPGLRDGTGPTPPLRRERTQARARIAAARAAGTLTRFDLLQQEFLAVSCAREPHHVLAELLALAATAEDWADAILQRARPLRITNGTTPGGASGAAA